VAKALIDASADICIAQTVIHFTFTISILAILALMIKSIKDEK
jgi:hypothetical protein